MKPIEFCIVVPAYNCVNYIENCVKSVCEGTYPHFHMLLVDDGSTDGTTALCDRLAEADPRIAVLHQKNAGALAARVAGVQYFQRSAQPDAFLYCLDSDDALTPNALEVLAAAIQKEGCDLVFLRSWWVYPDGSRKNCDPISMPVGTITDKKQFYKLVLCDDGYNAMWHKAVRLNLFPEEDYHRYYGMRLAEDLLQSLALYKNCTRITFLPEVLYLYSVNFSSAVNTVRYDNFKSSAPIYREVWNFFLEEPLLDENDRLDYLHACRLPVRETLWNAARFRTSRQNVINTLKNLSEEPEYRRILSAAYPYDLDLKLLKNGWFFPLWLLGRFYLAAAITYHKLKRDGR